MCPKFIITEKFNNMAGQSLLKKSQCSHKTKFIDAEHKNKTYFHGTLIKCTFYFYEDNLYNTVNMSVNIDSLYNFYRGLYILSYI